MTSEQDYIKELKRIATEAGRLYGYGYYPNADLAVMVVADMVRDLANAILALPVNALQEDIPE